jgi:hypothetical protein
MLPTNVAPITIASIVLSAPEFNISFHPRRPQFCLLLICAQATTERCSPESTGLFEDLVENVGRPVVTGRGPRSKSKLLTSLGWLCEGDEGLELCPDRAQRSRQAAGIHSTPTELVQRQLYLYRNRADHEEDLQFENR